MRYRPNHTSSYSFPYPFGLTMQGISSKAVSFGEPGNKMKYNGIEKEDDLELNIYDAQFRELDPQTARWWQIDPVTDGYENLSPYASMYDNPLTVSDPFGNEGESCCGGWKVLLGPIGLLLPDDGPSIPATDPVGSVVANTVVPRVADATDNVLGQTLLTTGAMFNQSLSNGTFGLYPSQTPFNSGDWGPDQVNASNLGSTVGNYLPAPIPVEGGGANLDVKPNFSSGTANVSISLKPDLKLIGIFKSDNLFATSNSSGSNQNNTNTKQSKVPKSTATQSIGNGKFTKTTEVKPGKGPGQSRAEYIKYKNANGKTIKMVKDSYDRGNKFQHRKIKLPETGGSN